MTSSENVDDELARRFRQVFNKEPVSQGQEESQKWKVTSRDEFNIDDEEVRPSSIVTGGFIVVGKVD